MLSIAAEDCCARVTVRECEIYSEIDAAEHCRVEVTLSVRCTDQKHVCAGLKTVNFPQ